MFCGGKLAVASTDAEEDGAATRIIAPQVPPTLFAPLAAHDLDFAVTRTGGAADDTTPDRAPSRISNFRLLRSIGSGGMGTVYEAVSTETGERVAVKLLSKRLAANPSSAERFRQEGRLASLITHPRCVFVLRADTDAGRPFIVMELMPGRTLKDLVDAKGPLPIHTALEHILDVIDGLREAHRLGVIHRDVKPSNCFLTADGRVKVGDFGLSKSLADSEGDKQLTGSGTFLGTVLFAAPEQIRHEPVGYDSDVYAVCATLYFLLAGQAPHQHESLTAVLAKAISEAPAPLRSKRADVPKALDRIVQKGLERDRTRRYATLDELAQALRDQLPSSQVPAGLRALSLAYIVDVVLLQIVQAGIEVVRQLFLHQLPDAENPFAHSWPIILLTLCYFWLFEALAGATPGKMLFRMTVHRLGQTGPPGLLWAGVRTLAYNSMWSLSSIVVYVAPQSFLQQGGFILVGAAWLASIGLLLVQIRRTEFGHRGLHDMLSGTRTIQRPQRQRRTRLVSKLDNPLDKPLPDGGELPKRVGLFTIAGKLCDVDDGGELWIGEDPSLGRRVLLRIEAPGIGDDSLHDEPIVRPTRLRKVGHGTMTFGGLERAWVAFVAPSGAPLTDIVRPGKPLSWGDAFDVLDQLVGELAEGERTSSNPAVLTTDQIWVEPNGRVQLLDFPILTGRAVAAGERRSRYPLGTSDPFRFLRQTASLMLEGTPRASDERIAAPLPPKSAAIVNRLMDREYGTLGALQLDLAEERTRPIEVTASIRIGQLSVQSLFLALGLVPMFIIAGMLNFFISFGVLQNVARLGDVSAALDTPEKRATWLAVARDKANDKAGKERLARLEVSLEEQQWEATERRIAERLKQAETIRDQANRRLNRIEREALDAAIVQMREPLSPDDGSALSTIDRAVRLVPSNEVRAGEADEGPRDPSQLFSSLDRIATKLTFVLMAVLAQWPVIVWPLFAVLFRGGLAHWIGGVTLVQRDGRPAARWRCGLRALVVWLPLYAVLASCTAVQLMLPEYVALRTILFLSAVAMLPLMVMVALRDPDRGPHDRLFGTTLVPR